MRRFAFIAVPREVNPVVRAFRVRAGEDDGIWGVTITPGKAFTDEAFYAMLDEFMMEMESRYEVKGRGMWQYAVGGGGDSGKQCHAHGAFSMCGEFSRADEVDAYLMLRHILGCEADVEFQAVYSSGVEGWYGYMEKHRLGRLRSPFDRP